MKISVKPESKARLIKQLTLHEGRRLKPYKDTVGKITIGVGRNLTDRGLSEEEVDFLLENDIRYHTEELFEALPWVADLDDVRQRVLIDMAFNLGVPGLLKFTNTLKAVQEGRWTDAMTGMLRSKWAQQTKTRATRLAQMMLTGKDSKDF